jgi:hypothetical protein
MLVTVLIVAMISVAAASTLDLVRIDLMIATHDRQATTSREVAEGAMIEVINDEQTPAMLPMLDDTDLTSTYTPPTSSPFVSSAAGHNYTATARLLRLVPLNESSQQYTRAIVHAVSVSSDVAHGEAAFTVEAEVYRTVSFKAGMVLPRRHAR